MTEIIKEGRIRERIVGGIIEADRKVEERMAKQFTKITKDTDPSLVLQVCGVLLNDYEREELGYYSRLNLEPSNDGDVNELREKIESWVDGFFGLRSDKKIGFIKQLVQVGHEGGGKHDIKEPKVTIESDFIKSTGINLSVSNIGTDQYKAVVKATDFARMAGYCPQIDSMLQSSDGYIRYDLYKIDDDLLKKSINLHLKNKSEEYLAAFKATYGWLLCGVFDDGVTSEKEKIRYISSLTEKLKQEQYYNSISPIKWRKTPWV
jgi:hypothetical protein